MKHRNLAVGFAIVGLATTLGYAGAILHDEPSTSRAHESIAFDTHAAVATFARTTLVATPIEHAGHASVESTAEFPVPSLRFVPPPATFDGEVVEVDHDVHVSTLVVAEGQTLVVAHGVELRADEWMDVRGTVEAAPRSDAHDGGSFSLGCGGPIHVGPQGLVAAGDGTSGEVGRDGTTDGGAGGAVDITCPVLVVDGLVRAGRGGTGGVAGSGGTGGGVHMTIADLWCLVPISARNGATQVRAGGGGNGGPSCDVASGDLAGGAPATMSGGSGGRNTYTLPDAALASAWGLDDNDPQSINDYVVDAGFVWWATDDGDDGDAFASEPGFYPAEGWQPAPVAPV